MAESTLSLTYTDLMKEVNYFLGYGRVATDTDGVVDPLVQSGYRQFLYPPPVGGQKSSYQWRFLRPVDSIIVWPTVAVNSGVTVTQSGTTLTATSASFYPSMIGKTVEITSETDVTITAYTSSTVVTVTPSQTIATPRTFSITSDGTFRLPDDYGGAESEFTFAPQSLNSKISIYGEAQVRGWLQLNNSTGAPRCAALRWLASTSTAGQRAELVLFPIPDQVYTLYYRKKVLPVALSATYLYPLGGMRMSELLLQSCLAVAERRLNGETGPQYEQFVAMLAAAIANDRDADAPDTFGFTRGALDYVTNVGDWHGSGTVTFEGVQY